MDHNGYIKLYRKTQENFIWKKNRRFSEFEAWVDLLLEAAWKEHKTLLCGKVITIPRGAVLHSERTLAKRWGWSLSSVSRFLLVLKNETMIKRNMEHENNLLIIVNYEHYQSNDIDDETPDKQKMKQSWNDHGTLMEQTEEGKERKEVSLSGEIFEISPELEELAMKVFGNVPLANLSEWIGLFGEDWVRRAMAVTEARKIKNVNYTLRILQDWKTNGKPDDRRPGTKTQTAVAQDTEYADRDNW